MKILDAYKFCPGPGVIWLLITILGNKFAYASHTSYNFKELIKFEEKKIWPWRDLNTQPSDLESDALPLRHRVALKYPWNCKYLNTARIPNACLRQFFENLKNELISY